MTPIADCCPQGTQGARHAARLAAAILLIVVLGFLVGCGTTTTTTNVPIPIVCAEVVPPRPVMPTETFSGPPTLDEYVQASLAELQFREGYEVKLRAGLIACTTPLKP